MSEPHGSFGSSTLRSAVLAALALWAPGAILLSLQHRDFSRHVLARAAGALDLDVTGFLEELLEVLVELPGGPGEHVA